jgi:hypothetical protein
VWPVIAIAEVPSGYGCYATPVARTPASIVSIVMTIAAGTVPPIVVVSPVVIARTRIAMVIRKRVPTDLIAKREIDNESD